MNMFYEPGLTPDTAVLGRHESHHCVKVLRLKEGVLLYITDGKGLLCKARLVKADPKGCLVKIDDVVYEYGKRPFSLHMAVAPTKSIDRFELFLEKACECGVDIITPVLCEKSERKVIKPARLEKLLIAAMKQSCRAYLPLLNPLMKLPEFINRYNSGKRFIAHCAEGEKARLMDAYQGGENIVIAIGPEGDFTEKEISLAGSNGFRAISMGNHRLRTETAAIATCIQANAVNKLL